MKAWRNEAARKINQERDFAIWFNKSMPKRERIEVPPTARRLMRAKLIMGKHMADRMVLTTWILAGLMIRAGIQPAG